MNEPDELPIEPVDMCQANAMDACQDAGMTWALFSSLQLERHVFHVVYGAEYPDEVAVQLIAHCEDCAIQALAENPPMHLEHLNGKPETEK